MSSDGKNSESPTIERVFELLDKWRHFPTYQLERRADVFFALFLPEVLGKRFGAGNLCLIPEFPIKKSLLPAHSSDTTSQSINVDFLGVEQVQDGKEPARRAFLVELKTDNASIKKDQRDGLLQAVNELGLYDLVEGVIDICNSSTKQKRKYAHLLKLLSFLDLVGYEGATFLPEWNKQRWGYSELLRGIKSKKVKESKDWPDLELVYVAPKPHKLLQEKEIDTIDFNSFADTIEKGESDGIGHTFANYLRKWADEDAGSPNPKDLSSC